ncbi:dentin sialophosphoprotein [Panicum miliaceum]|uniref:Dentin sialophosphoprotein n=1 Tax=Panicum miliaceum TaxID=4540 RepID=A0A3L6ST13_PANMI|nr:dentin sialophosphoprotein [Panicum miliaceum]
MGEPLAEFSVEGVSSSPCLCRNTCEKPGCEHSYACLKDEQDDLVVEEIGMALTEVIHAYSDGDNDEGPDLDEDSSDDDDDDLVLSMESDSTDDLVDVDSEFVISSASPSGDASESSISKSVDEKSSILGAPRLVSAMKGTRAKQGIVTKLSVSWAPDVYDPPVTSDSHTVRGHQRSSRKGHYKYKPSKSSSSSRSTSGSKKDKKHSRHSSSSSKKDRKHSSRNASTSGSNRTETSSSHYRKAYNGGGISSSRTVTCVPESSKVPPLVLAESAALPEILPILKTMEPIKCATSCGKEKPFALLSRQLSPARYKGMFSFWSQNQLAS